MKFWIAGLILNLDTVFPKLTLVMSLFSASVQPVSFANGQTDGARDSCDRTIYCFIDHEYHPEIT